MGIMSCFLGIGGSPINLIVLGYFFSMTMKRAAANSLYIILFSQITSFLSTLLPALLIMFGGVYSGIVGRMANKKLDNQAVDRLFIGLMVVIIAVSPYNSVQYIL